ncbi:MAG: hypothetical protein ACP5G1_04650, partial [Nanopusillaceae archaeon]
LIGLYNTQIAQTSLWQELSRRRTAQVSSIVETVEIADKLGVELLVVKTLKPFLYVPDDIDILVIDDEKIDYLIEYLRKKGYFIRKIGTPEITMRKLTNKTYVDLDIHTKMAAGPYVYIDKYYLWKRHIYKTVLDRKIPTPNDVDEILITVGHGIMKEFHLLLADIFHLLSITPEMHQEARLQAEKIGLSTPYKYTMRVATSFINHVVSEVSRPKQLGNALFGFPRKVPLAIIIKSYLENLNYRVKKEHTTPIKQLIKAPSSKGIGILLRYLGI